MKLTVFFTLALAMMVETNEAQSIDNFEEFKKVFQKSYSSQEEESRRREIFYQSLAYVQQHAGTVVNVYSDLTSEEFKQAYMMPKGISQELASFSSADLSCNFTLKTNVPASKDLRSEKRLTPIKTQGSCGSCWIFSSIAATESAYITNRNETLDLSEQEMVDCASPKSCSGEFVETAMDYLKTKGAVDEKELPYKAKQEPCPKLNAKRHKISGWCRSFSNSTEKIKQILHTKDSALVAILSIGDISALQHHDGKSIITHDSETRSALHAINIVGFGHKDGLDYWIIRNSWGPKWGDAGYGYIEQHKNIMKINELVYIPLV